MPGYIVTLKSSATDAELNAAKKKATEQGGKIGHTYTLFKGFSVAFDNDAVTTLESDPNVQSVEEDQEVKTQ